MTINPNTVVMKKELWLKLIGIAKENKIHYTKHNEPHNWSLPTYFWTKGNTTFYGHSILIDEWEFYELCCALGILET